MNRLSKETSPYLKQHETNPVDWYPWGPEALEKAKVENKPILLSVGYSACHWCHVMAHESFENQEIASLMNEHFVNIKVDREERPDLDQIYQVVAQLMTQGGGWPLTVFLTPDLKPFYGGTYFPPTDRYGRPGFPKVLISLAKAYQMDRADIDDRAEKITKIIQNYHDWDSKQPDVDARPSERSTVLMESARKLLTYLDWENGGIGSAPKFPNTTALSFLWRMNLASFVPEEDRKSFREGVILALEKMRRGGIFDQIGGGFHRYAVDATWSVPHFEKMLYDNAQLLKLYSEVLLTDSALEPDQSELFLSALSKTVIYLKREMVSPEGLFYSAQDADSEGEEGKYFVWTKAELKELLSQEEYDPFVWTYGMTDEGNFENQTNVLYLAHHLHAHEVTDAEAKVLKARDQRIKPGLDNKILVSWNALMISGLSWASLALEKAKPEIASAAREMAKKAYQELIQRAQSPADATGAVELASTIQAGRKKGVGFLDDYAYLALAELDLARAFPEMAKELIESSKRRLNYIHENFEAPLGYFFTPENHESLIHRPQSLFDQATPSGSGTAYYAQVVLAELDPDAAGKLDRDEPRLNSMVVENGFGMSEILNALLLREVGPLIVKGEAEEKYRTHPFSFVVDHDFKEAGRKITQYCRKQTCALEAPGTRF